MIWDSMDDWDDPRITHSQKGSFNKDFLMRDKHYYMILVILTYCMY